MGKQKFMCCEPSMEIFLLPSLPLCHSTCKILPFTFSGAAVPIQTLVMVTALLRGPCKVPEEHGAGCPTRSLSSLVCPSGLDSIGCSVLSPYRSLRPLRSCLLDLSQFHCHFLSLEDLIRRWDYIVFSSFPSRAPAWSCLQPCLPVPVSQPFLLLHTSEVYVPGRWGGSPVTVT